MRTTDRIVRSHLDCAAQISSAISVRARASLVNELPYVKLERRERKTMFRAEIVWGRQGPILKLDGKLARDWAEQARALVTNEVVPRALIVDITEVSYVDRAGEELLLWLASLEAKFIRGYVYVKEVCERLELPLTGDLHWRTKRP
jgi:ABC-type transporter Mla MlaB component